MKNSKLIAGALTLLIAGSVMLVSCKKKEKSEPQVDHEYSTASDNALAENTVNDIASMGSQLSENSGTLQTFKSPSGNQVVIPELMFGGAPSCATVTAAFTNSVATSYTIDFGNAGCVGADGRTRKGKLYYNFAASTPTTANRYRKPGFKMQVSSAGYEVDGNQVSITKTVTNTSPLSIASQTVFSGTNLTWHIDANVTIIRVNNAGKITWNCSRDKELINSNDPNCYKGQNIAIDWTKAKVKLNGTASGTNIKEEAFSAKAIDLIRDFTCNPNNNGRRPFVQGKVEYTPGDRPIRYIDYGNGECDFNATVTINGQTFIISIY